MERKYEHPKIEVIVFEKAEVFLALSKDEVFSDYGEW